MPRISSVRDVVEWRLCLGCGACAYICPEKNITLSDVLTEGIRPFVNSARCGSCSLCLDVCPSVETDHAKLNRRPGIDTELREYCGPVLDVWEGHAVDSEIRLAGSSGGVITALSLYCMAEGGMHGVLHIGADPDCPVRNRTRMSTSRDELLENTGSRYAPASACDSLHLIESAPSKCVFVGQPSEVTALRKAAVMRPQLSQNVGLAISFFCAGSPSTKGTLDLLAKLGISSDELASLRYRGRGWPGMFAATTIDNAKPKRELTYRESWGFLQAYRPLSTHLCPDGSGEDADISCGDPWYREVNPGEPGSSLVLVRTELGRQIIAGAVKAGYLQLERADANKVVESQRNLLGKRGAIWGRITTMKLMGLPVPRLKGFSLFRNWLRLSFEEKLRSTFGTARRVLRRGYYRRLQLHRSPPNSLQEAQLAANSR